MQLRKLITTLLTGFLFASNLIYCQNSDIKGDIRGKVIDSKTKLPIEYSTIALLSSPDSSIITGTISGKDGYFILRDIEPGQYHLQINFLSYQEEQIDNISITENKRHIDVGEIILKPSVVAIKEVEIKGEKAAIEYKIDKKVVNVSKQLSAVGGTATDALKNIPAIETTIEGDVKLRGSSNFTLLIDGRPTVINASDMLKQIPAGTIDRIEIITNPSAKYDPNGTAGIINVILKKNALEGFSGIVNLSGGTGYQYSGGVSLNYRTKKLSLSGGIENNEHNISTTEISNRETYLDDTTKYLSSHNEGVQYSNNKISIKGGLDYLLTLRNTISLSGKYSPLSLGHKSETNYHQWTNFNNAGTYYLSEDKFEINPDVLELNLGDEHQFDSTGLHKLNFNAFAVFASVNTDENLLKYITDPYWHKHLGINNIIKRITNESTRVLNMNLDYTKPLGNKGNIEAGYQFKHINSNKDYGVLSYNETLNRWENDSLQSNSLNFKRDIHALYGTFSCIMGKWEAKAGLRLEYTNRVLTQETLNEDYIYEKLDFYPSAYISRTLPYDQQLQISYSRRINRPPVQLLNPFTFYSDGFISVNGNPDLKPDYTNSFELNYLRRFGASFVSVETYFRQTYNKITRIQEIDEDGVLVRTMKNMDNDYSLGVETMGNIKIAHWLELTPRAILYKYHLKGNYNDADVIKNSQNWRVGLITSFKLKTHTYIQLTNNYESPSVTLDGKREGVFFSGFAVKQNMFKKRANLSFRVEDIFNTRKMKPSISSDSFYQSSVFYVTAPQFILSFTYRYNNFRNRKKNDNDIINQYNNIY